MPTSSEPGTTSRPSSVNTFVVGLQQEHARSSAPAAVRRDLRAPSRPRCEFMMSSSVDVGHPVEQLLLDLGRPHRARRVDPQHGCRRSYGAAGARPLVDRLDDRLGEHVADDGQVGDAGARSIASSSSWASKRPARQRDDRAADDLRARARRASAPVPCISGAHGTVTTRSASAIAGHERRHVVERRQRVEAELAAAPPAANDARPRAEPEHHALGHAGGAARVEQERCPRRARRCAASGRAPATSVLVGDGAGDERGRRRRATCDEQLQRRRAGRRRRATRSAERRVEHQRLGVGVLEQVARAPGRGSGS